MIGAMMFRRGMAMVLTMFPVFGLTHGTERISLAAESTISALELDKGDKVDFILRNGQVRKLQIVSTGALRIGTNVYAMSCSLLVDGHGVTLRRFIPVQESFCEPQVINGLRIWLDGVQDLFTLLTEKHGACKPSRNVRLVLNDAMDRICPSELVTWYQNDERTIRVQDSYGGQDVWMGPYNNQDAHGGRDVNMSRGSGLFAPFDIDDHCLFKNGGWIGLRRWNNGSVWTIQSHHLAGMTIAERGFIKAGKQYGKAAGTAVGSFDHSHFILRIRDRRGVEISVDPWILFWQSFKDQEVREGRLQVSMLSLAPAHVGAPVKFSTSGAEKPQDSRVEYIWNFGDGAYSRQEKPIHTFTKSGMYSVVLTIDNGTERKQTVQSLTVDGPAATKNSMQILCPEELSFRTVRPGTVLAYDEKSLSGTAELEFVVRGSAFLQTREVQIVSDGEVGMAKVKHAIKYTGAGKRWLNIQKRRTGNSTTLSISANANGIKPGRYKAVVEIVSKNAINGSQQIGAILDVQNDAPTSTVMIDNASRGFYRTPGFWVGRGMGFSPGLGKLSVSNGDRLIPGEFVRFTPHLHAGIYDVSIPPESPLSEGQTYSFSIKHGKGITNVSGICNSQRKLGRFEFSQGTSGYVQFDAIGGRDFTADAMLFKAVKEPKPVLAVLPEIIRYNVAQGYNEIQPSPFFQIKNLGNDTAAFSATCESVWVKLLTSQAALDPGQVATVRISFDAAHLAPGVYPAVIKLTSTNAVLAAGNLPMVLTVSGVPEQKHLAADPKLFRDALLTVQIDSVVEKRNKSARKVQIRLTAKPVAERVVSMECSAVGFKRGDSLLLSIANENKGWEFAPMQVVVASETTKTMLEARAPAGVFQHWSKGVLPKLALTCTGPEFSKQVIVDANLESLDHDPPLRVSQASHAFVIDGSDSEWADVKHIELAQGGPIAKLTWRPDGIYGLIDVKDNLIVSDRVEFYKNDCIELFVDTDNSKSYTLENGSVQYVLFPPGPDAGKPLVAVPRDKSEYFGQGIVSAAQKTDGGYMVEFRIGSSILGGKSLTIAKSVGINFAVNDDGASAAFLHIRPGDRSAFCHPVAWGTIRCTE